MKLSQLFRKNSLNSSSLYRGSVVIILVLVLAVVGGGILSSNYANQQKKEIKELSEKQAKDFSELQVRYQEIVNEYKESSKEAHETSSELTTTKLSQASADNTQVLGLEDSPVIVSRRRLLELYKDGNDLTKQIMDRNKVIEGKVNNPIVKLVVKGESPVKKTNEFGAESSKIFTFFEKNTEIEIKAVTVGYDLGMALGDSINKNGDEESIKKLEEKIEDLKALAKEESEIDTATVPDDLKDTFEKSKKNSEMIVDTFTKIVDYLRKKDVGALQRAFEDISKDAAVEGEKSNVVLTSFWQNSSNIRSAESLHKEWANFANSL
jgi:hypothetical protein